MARPFIKWPGGKAKLLPVLEALLPQKITHYYEPFVGGGALFFRVQELRPEIEEFLLNDLNEDLMQTYQCVKVSNKEISRYLQKIAAFNSEKNYYECRDLYNKRDLDRYECLWETIALFIYLNRTCFNGLYRVNKRGEFNVPYGHYKNPEILISQLREDASVAFKRAGFSALDFQKFLEVVEPQEHKHSFVYLDPPYEPLVDKTSFTAYTSQGFGRVEQERLAKVVKWLNASGVKFMLSNSDTPYIRETYRDFNIHSVEVPRTIARRNRDSANELVIRNYTS